MDAAPFLSSKCSHAMKQYKIRLLLSTGTKTWSHKTMFTRTYTIFFFFCRSRHCVSGDICWHLYLSSNDVSVCALDLYYQFNAWSLRILVCVSVHWLGFRYVFFFALTVPFIARASFIGVDMKNDTEQIWHACDSDQTADNLGYVDHGHQRIRVQCACAGRCEVLFWNRTQATVSVTTLSAIDVCVCVSGVEQLRPITITLVASASRQRWLFQHQFRSANERPHTHSEWIRSSINLC